MDFFRFFGARMIFRHLSCNLIILHLLVQFDVISTNMQIANNIMQMQMQMVCKLTNKYRVMQICMGAPCNETPIAPYHDPESKQTWRPICPVDSSIYFGNNSRTIRQIFNIQKTGYSILNCA